MGFRVLSKRPLDELDAVLWEMEHEQTGAKLVWLDRAEENKTFCIAFQTQPWDDTGVFHILEHSVLCGSRRYPVKKPFVELIKTSLNTFLNAITFPDKTIYPVSSRNDQDFLNLMRVYMDAVLHPVLLQRPEIFCQEGWHYEVDDDGGVSCKGVVFNEMKGVFSSPDALLEYAVNQRLFPDTCYRWVAGGDPEHIPELTYERFVQAHSRFYHPSNAYIFLDGALDLDTVLDILDGEYLADYTRIQPPPPVPLQTPVDSPAETVDYELGAETALSGHYRLALGFSAGTYRDREQLTALRALCDALCGDNEAPLKRRLMADGLAQDVRMVLNDGVLQPSVILEVRNLEESRMEEAVAVVESTLETLAEGGLDHRRILATLDNLEFGMRERDAGWMPQGLALGRMVLESWLYGGDPAEKLCVGTLFETLRKQCSEGYFEELIHRVLLKNPHRCRVILRPSHSLGTRRAAREMEQIRAVCAQWDEGQWEAARRIQKQTELWQRSPDTQEARASMPVLRLDQIAPRPEQVLTREVRLCGLPVWIHPLSTHGITYLNLYFAADDLEPRELCAAAFLCELLGSFDTRNSTAAQLPGRIRSRFGSLQFGMEAYGAADDPARCRIVLCAGASVLNSKVESGVSLLTELLRDTLLNDAGKIFAILRQRRTALAQQIGENGSAYAMTRAGAGFSAECAAEEYTGGIAYLRWLEELEEKGSGELPALICALQDLAGKLFSCARLILSVSTDEDASANRAADVLARQLPAGAYEPPEACAVRPWGRRREGIVLPADISFAAISGPFPAANRGSARVMKRILALDYLWNAVRVRGGAYGAGAQLRSTGLMSCFSYRDPNAAGTLSCFWEIPYFLQEFAGPVEGTIVGAVAESEPLLTPRMKGKTADVYWWKGISYEDLCRMRQEMLAATSADVAAYGAAMEDFLRGGGACVLGPRRQLEACGGQLDEIFAL